jgi:hypothetical protein
MRWTLVLVVLAALCAAGFAQTTHFVGTIAVKNAGLLNTFTHTGNTNNKQKFSILAASYDTGRSTYDSTYALQWPGNHIERNFTGYTPISVFNFLYWPKEVRQVPRSVFGHDAIVHSDGSLIFGKGRGSIYVTDMHDFLFPATYDLAQTLLSSSYMYASVVWKEIDRDGRDDILTCRVIFEGEAILNAQLVWLTHPIGGLKDGWRSHVLKESACDSNIAEAEFRLGLFDNYEVVYTTGYYTQRLTYFWSEGRNWDDPDKIWGGVIEAGRQYYDVTTYDINRDGEVDLLVTVVAAAGGSVEVFQIPDDFRESSKYVRRVLADGFTARNGGASGRAPGVARPFYPTANKQRKPWILVSGGDDGRAYYLKPRTETASDWNYDLIVVADLGASETVSGMTSADVDGDGYEDFFVSSHNQNLIYFYSMGP